MRPNPALDAFVADQDRVASVRQQGSAIITVWRADPEVAELVATLDALAADPALTSERMELALARWTGDHGWLRRLFAAGLSALAAEPLLDMGWRMLPGQVIQGIALMDAPQASVTLCWLDAKAQQRVESREVAFDGGHSLMQVIVARGLVVQRHRIEGDRLISDPSVAAADGQFWCTDNARESIAIDQVAGEAVLLRFNVQPPGSPPHLHAYDRTSGQLARRAMGDPAAARLLPMLSIPRLAGQSRGIDTVAGFVGHADRSLRWAAMREWLALDAATAWPALIAMAEHDPDDDVRRTAAATRAALSPQMEEHEVRLCPA